MNKAISLSLLSLSPLPLSLSLSLSLSPFLSLSHLSILEDKEAHIFSMMDFVFSEHWRCIVLDPHSRQLVAMDVIVIKSTLQIKNGTHNFIHPLDSMVIYLVKVVIPVVIRYKVVNSPGTKLLQYLQCN